LKKQEKKRLQIEDMKATLATKPLDEKAAAAAAELKESLAKGK
jgi:predicted nucleic acid-binding protein